MLLDDVEYHRVRSCAGECRVYSCHTDKCHANGVVPLEVALPVSVGPREVSRCVSFCYVCSTRRYRAQCGTTI